MQKYQDVVLNQNGNPVSGVQVTVTDLLGTPVSVYSSNAIGLNVNPLTSDNNGRFSFYAPDGRYSLSFSFGGNVVASITDILLEDPMDGSDAVFNDVTILGELSDASKVTSAPVGGLTATNVQAALAELDSEKIDASSLAASGGSDLVGFKQSGTGAVDRTAQDKLREVVSVKDFGAVGDGVADDTAAVLLAFQHAATLTSPRVYFPSGKYKIVTSSTLFRLVSGMEVYGDGMDATQIVWAANFTGSTIVLLAGQLTDTINSATIRDLSIRGDHDTTGYTESACYPILVERCDNLKIHRVRVQYSRTMGIVVRTSFAVDVDGCVVQWCARDGINTADCNYVKVVNNRVEFCDDDGIACHTQYYNVADRGWVISGNIVRFSQGIKALAASSASITGNTIEFCMSQGISVSCTVPGSGSIEGLSAASGVVISGNTIKNCIDRANVDGRNATTPYIRVSGNSAQAGGLAAIPGLNETGTGTVVSPYPYFGNTNNADASLPTPVSYNIVIVGNVCVRDIPTSGLLSSLGYGTFYTRTGPVDPTLSAAAVRESGVNLSGGQLRNVLIHSNTFSGIGTALSIPSTGTYVDIHFNANIVYDCDTCVGASGSLSHRIYLTNNIIDLDPFHANTNRGANGTWLAAGNPTAFLFQTANGFSIGGNIIRNVCRLSDTGMESNTVLQGAKVQLLADNIIECDPSATGFSTGNKGVGTIPRGPAFIARVIDSDPASATFGTVLNNCPTSANAMPTAGKYVAGHFVRNNQPAITGTAGSRYIVLGWSRITTGSGHVLNTDWAELRTLTGT